VVGKVVLLERPCVRFRGNRSTGQVVAIKGTNAASGGIAVRGPEDPVVTRSGNPGFIGKRAILGGVNGIEIAVGKAVLVRESYRSGIGGVKNLDRRAFLL